MRPIAASASPAGPAKLVDATGAGDTFDGASLPEYLRTGDPFAASRHANVAAALAVKGLGAVAPIPRRTDIEAAIKAAWPAGTAGRRSRRLSHNATILLVRSVQS